MLLKSEKERENMNFNKKPGSSMILLDRIYITFDPWDFNYLAMNYYWSIARWVWYSSYRIVERYLPVDTGRKLNLHKTFKRRPGRHLNVLCTFNLRPVSTGSSTIKTKSYLRKVFAVIRGSWQDIYFVIVTFT